MLEYHHFNKQALVGSQVEPFSSFNNDAPSQMIMNTDIKNTNLVKARDELKEDKTANYDETVNNPNSYGYIASLPEVRSQNENEIMNQQQSILAISAVAGVSLIVLGILINSSDAK